MAGTGASVEEINKYLGDLNDYADKTIYSFSDMTQNIGKFTNAGVSLSSATNAIKGVSNVAAIAGANTQQASHAMYNFAQALSSGSVRLQDWRSIELANLATVEFKQALIDTGVAMGTLVKEGDSYVSTTTDLKGKVSDAFDATNNFNNSLAHQWMTTDVLVQTLENYSTDIRDMTEDENTAICLENIDEW
jgi:tape measure domain-containing protein